jgi:hypothetical protein
MARAAGINRMRAMVESRGEVRQSEKACRV